MKQKTEARIEMKINYNIYFFFLEKKYTLISKLTYLPTIMKEKKIRLIKL